jgi:RNA-directed DNA polymerase
LDSKTEFYRELSNELVRAGFKINEKKNRLQMRDSRQTVTGLVVNKKINVNRHYYKETRAMANRLYKHGSFEINGTIATLNQLEGRLAFINQLSWYNNKINNGKKKFFRELDSRERQYQKFLFYKYFFCNPKPLIVTEGKTDIAYLKSALKNLYKEYPGLITKNSDGTYEYKISFLRKTKRLEYFLGILRDGAGALNNIYTFFDNKKSNQCNYLSEFKKLSNNFPKNPVVLMFDNEIESGKKKPIGNFLSTAKVSEKKKSILISEYKINIIDNLYLLTVPLTGQKSECDIEDLFDESTLSHKIEGREFSKKADYDVSKYYGKEIFSKYILKNCSKINFSAFRPVLDNINTIIDVYPNTYAVAGSELEPNKIDKSVDSEVLVEV